MNDELLDPKEPLWATLAQATTVPVAPSASLRQRLMERLQNGPKSEVRSGGERWRRTEFPGVDICPLHRDHGTGMSTFYLRMQPGAEIPAHLHGADEQCLVVQGDLTWGGHIYGAGDFFVTNKNSRHPVSATVGGNLLLIIAGENEYVHA